MQSIIPVSPPGDFGPVVSEVDRQLRGRLREFRISPDGEGLVLAGIAPSFYVKQLAQHAVRRLSIVGLVLKIVARSVNYRLCPRTAIIRSHMGDRTLRRFYRQLLAEIAHRVLEDNRLLHSFMPAVA